jgi:hypothetical protein
MAEENIVHIVEWPKDLARLEHRFELEKPCPVSISFEQTPARVVLSSSPDQPISVAMNMNVTVSEPIPVCIKVCERICARSDYTIGINIFDNPFALITVHGMTRLFNCHEESSAEETCVTFQEVKEGTEFAQPFTFHELVFTPLNEPLRAATFGDPAGRVKLAFPRTGLRITFSTPSHDIRITVNNYAGSTLEFSVFASTTLLTRFSEPVSNTVKEVRIAQSGVTDIEITGGDNEASIVEVCYTPMNPA